MSEAPQSQPEPPKVQSENPPDAQPQQVEPVNTPPGQPENAQPQLETTEIFQPQPTQPRSQELPTYVQSQPEQGNQQKTQPQENEAEQALSLKAPPAQALPTPSEGEKIQAPSEGEKLQGQEVKGGFDADFPSSNSNSMVIPNTINAIIPQGADICSTAADCETCFQNNMQVFHTTQGVDSCNWDVVSNSCLPKKGWSEKTECPDVISSGASIVNDIGKFFGMGSSGDKSEDKSEEGAFSEKGTFSGNGAFSESGTFSDMTSGIGEKMTKMMKTDAIMDTDGMAMTESWHVLFPLALIALFLCCRKGCFGKCCRKEAKSAAAGNGHVAEIAVTKKKEKKKEKADLAFGSNDAMESASMRSSQPKSERCASMTTLDEEWGWESHGDKVEIAGVADPHKTLPWMDSSHGDASTGIQTSIRRKAKSNVSSDWYDSHSDCSSLTTLNSMKSTASTISHKNNHNNVGGGTAAAPMGQGVKGGVFQTLGLSNTANANSTNASVRSNNTSANSMSSRKEVEESNTRRGNPSLFAKKKTMKQRNFETQKKRTGRAPLVTDKYRDAGDAADFNWDDDLEDLING